VVFTTPYQMKMSLLVSETSSILSGGKTAQSGSPNNVTYAMTTLAGYTAEDGNPAGMVTIDLSNFKETARDKQEELLASVGKSDIDLPAGTNIKNLPESITYMVTCNGKEPAGLKVKLPDGTCNDVKLFGSKKIPSQSFVTALVCEQVSPLEAFKERCAGWSPSEEGMESGTDCETPPLAEGVENSAGTLKFRSLGNTMTAMMEPDTSNPDLFKEGVVETKTEMEIVFDIPASLATTPTTAGGEDGNNNNRKLLQMEMAGVGEFVSQIQAKFGGGAQISGNEVTFKVMNDVVDTIDILDLEQVSQEDAFQSMSVCA